MFSLKQSNHSLFFMILSLTTTIMIGCEEQKTTSKIETPQTQTTSETTSETISVEPANTFSAPEDRLEPVEETVNGTYTYEGSDAKCKILVVGEQWTGSFTFVSGLGAEYDASQAEFQTGLVRGNEIFDESGYVKIGYIEGKNLTTTVGGQYITLRKR
jgi:hypothetical protein